MIAYYQIIETSVEIVIDSIKVLFTASSTTIPYMIDLQSFNMYEAREPDGSNQGHYNTWESYLLEFKHEFKDLELKSIYEIRIERNI